MKADTFYLYDGDKLIGFSGSFEKLLKKTWSTKGGKIYFNGVLVWVQKP